MPALGCRRIPSPPSTNGPLLRRRCAILLVKGAIGTIATLHQIQLINVNDIAFKEREQVFQGDSQETLTGIHRISSRQHRASNHHGRMRKPKRFAKSNEGEKLKRRAGKRRGRRFQKVRTVPNNRIVSENMNDIVRGYMVDLVITKDEEDCNDTRSDLKDASIRDSPSSLLDVGLFGAGNREPHPKPSCFPSSSQKAKTIVPAAVAQLNDKSDLDEFLEILDFSLGPYPEEKSRSKGREEHRAWKRQRESWTFFALDAFESVCEFRDKKTSFPFDFGQFSTPDILAAPYLFRLTLAYHLIHRIVAAHLNAEFIPSLIARELILQVFELLQNEEGYLEAETRIRRASYRSFFQWKNWSTPLGVSIDWILPQGEYEKLDKHFNEFKSRTTRGSYLANVADFVESRLSPEKVHYPVKITKV